MQSEKSILSKFPEQTKDNLLKVAESSTAHLSLMWKIRAIKKWKHESIKSKHELEN